MPLSQAVRDRLVRESQEKAQDEFFRAEFFRLGGPSHLTLSLPLVILDCLRTGDTAEAEYFKELLANSEETEQILASTHGLM